MDMIVCGIDPGLDTSGYAVLSVNGQRHVSAQVDSMRDAGVIRTAAAAPLADRLVQIAHDVAELFGQWKPSAVGVEQLYAHYKHPRTAILMGHARGVILAEAARCGIAVHSFNPTQVKRHLTGNGRASKAQMQRVVVRTFGLAASPEPADVADALAIAMVCAYECRRCRVEALSA